MDDITCPDFEKAREEEHKKINLAIVAANNHYAGFGPGTRLVPYLHLRIIRYQ